MSFFDVDSPAVQLMGAFHGKPARMVIHDFFPQADLWERVDEKARAIYAGGVAPAVIEVPVFTVESLEFKLFKAMNEDAPDLALLDQLNNFPPMRHRVMQVAKAARDYATAPAARHLVTTIPEGGMLRFVLSNRETWFLAPPPVHWTWGGFMAPFPEPPPEPVPRIGATG